MESIIFLISCILALTVVFLVLFVLSLSIRTLTTIFPEKSSQDDPAFLAAITAQFSSIFPQSKITQIEEKK